MVSLTAVYHAMISLNTLIRISLSQYNTMAHTYSFTKVIFQEPYTTCTMYVDILLYKCNVHVHMQPDDDPEHYGKLNHPNKKKTASVAPAASAASDGSEYGKLDQVSEYVYAQKMHSDHYWHACCV